MWGSIRRWGTLVGLRRRRARGFLVVLTGSAVLLGTAAAPAGWASSGVPGAPRSFTAVASESTVTVTWDAPSSSGTSSISAYVLSTTPVPASGPSTQVDGNARTATIAGFTNGTPYTLSIVAVNASGAGPPAQAPPVTPDHPGGHFVAVTPYRVCDTRAGNPFGLTGIDAQCTGQTLGADATLTFTVAGTSPSAPGAGGVPPTAATAVVLNVTVTGTTAASSLNLWPAGQARPGTENASWSAGETRSSSATVRVGTGGAVSVHNVAGQTDIEVDIDGYVVASGPDLSGLFNPVPAYRVCDTRSGNPSGLTGPNARCKGKTLDSTSVLKVKVAGTSASGTTPLSVPAKNVAAVLIDVTTTAAAGAGELTAWPTGHAQPLVPSIAWAGASTISDRLIVPVGKGGRIDLANTGSDVDVFVDVDGWFTDGTDPTANGSYTTAVQPQRVCDTRPGNPSGLTGPYAQCNGSSGSGSTLGANETLTINAAGLAGVPDASSGIPPAAVVLNVTATGTTAAGSLTVSPPGTRTAIVPDLTWTAGQTVGVQIVASLGVGSKLSIFNGAGGTDVLVDVLGFESGATVVPPSTHVLSHASQKLLTAVAADQSSITFSGTNAQLASILPGSVVATGVTKLTRGGLLLAVTDVATSGGELTMSTRLAELSEALPQGSLGLSSAPLELAPSEVADRLRPAATEPPGSTHENACGLSINFQATTFTLTPNVNLDWGLFPPHVRLDASLRLDATFQSSVVVPGSISITCQKFLGGEFADIKGFSFVTPVGLITLQYRLGVAIAVKGAINITRTTSTTTAFFAQAGFTFDGSFHPQSSNGCNAPVPQGTPACTQVTDAPTDVQGSLEFSVGPEFDLALALNEGTMGRITFGLQAPYLQATFQTGAPNWKVALGIQFTISAGIGVGPIDVSVTFTPFNWSFVIAHAVEVDTTGLTKAIATASYQESVVATGGNSHHLWSLVSDPAPPPSWLSIDQSGVLSGTPPIGDVGKQFTFGVEATDPADASATQTLTLGVGPPVSVTTPASLPNATVGAYYVTSLAAAGGTPNYAWSAAPGSSNPTWITIGPSGYLVGTPPPDAGGNDFDIGVQVTDTTKPQATVATATLHLHVVPLSVQTTTLPLAAVAQQYVDDEFRPVTLVAQGGTPPYTWALGAGTTLPGWLTLDPSNGTLSGTPGPGDVGTASVRFAVTDSNGVSRPSVPLAVTVQPFQIAPTGLPGGAVGNSYSASLQTIGGAPPRNWSVQSGSSLPVWLSLTPEGLLSGNPPPSAQGTTVSIPVQVADASEPPLTASATLTLPISPWASVQPTDFLTGSVSCAKKTMCIAVRDDAPHAMRWNGTTWTAQAMPLPAGATGAQFSKPSCATVTFCVVLGNTYGDAGPGAPVIEQYNGTSWSLVAPPDQLAGEYFDNVSCSSATFCMLAGQIGLSPYFARWDGHAWAEIPAPTTTGVESATETVLSCTSPQFCMFTAGIGTGGSARWNGANWQPLTVQNRDGTRVDEPDQTASWRDMDCAAPTDCMVTGIAWLQHYGVTATLEHWNGTAWQVLPEGGFVPDAISCPQIGDCYGSTYSDAGGTPIAHWNGLDWSPVDVTFQGRDGFGVDLTSISCADTRDCMAIGTTGPYNDLAPFAVTYRR